MEKKVDVKKKVFNKPQYIKTINTKFNELGVTDIIEDIESTVTVTNFFQYYDELFFEIPSTGPKNSHEYLVKTSGEYINYDQDSDIVKALQEEITSLREENLQLQIDIVKAQTGENISITSSLDAQVISTDNTDVLNSIGAGGLNGL